MKISQLGSLKIYTIALIFLVLSNISNSQNQNNIEWDISQIDDESGITLRIEVGIQEGKPSKIKYSIFNTNETPTTVWLPEEKAGFSAFISITQVNDVYRSITSIPPHDLPMLTPKNMASGEVLNWEFELVELVNDIEKFNAIDNFERLGINLRLPYMISKNQSEDTEMRSRRGVSLRWRWPSKMTQN